MSYRLIDQAGCEYVLISKMKRFHRAVDLETPLCGARISVLTPVLYRKIKKLNPMPYKPCRRCYR